MRIHPIRTGSVQIKVAQRERRPGGLLRVITGLEWTDWLPIYAWLIEHPEGPIVVDTGETARTADPGYFPRWHPYYRFALHMDVKPEDEVGPQLERMGLDSSDVKTVVLTHFHTDHAGGLHHFPRSRILVPGADHALARSTLGRLMGYLPGRWPGWFEPMAIPFRSEPVGPFPASFPVTREGDVVIVPTPGHTPHHISVIARSGGVSVFLAGDTSYTQSLLLERRPDGVSPRPRIALATMDAILRYARSEPTVYLPSHDPESVERLEGGATLDVPVTTRRSSDRCSSRASSSVWRADSFRITDERDRPVESRLRDSERDGKGT